jgi:hypothetical protein
MSLSGLPHSDILGSKPVCGSPKLFAAYHVLHRLLAPRHSPYALSSLTIVLELETNAYRASLPAVRDSKRRTTNRDPRIAACDSSFTHCCVVVGKTTVCRIFNGQRTSAKLSAGQPFSSQLREGRARGQLLSTLAECRERPSALDQPSNLPIRRAPFQARPKNLFSPWPAAARPKAAAKAGEYRARTGDLLVANQALSQLS